MAAVPTNAVKVVIRTQQGWSSLIKPYIFSTLAIGASVTTGDFICQYLERNKENTGGIQGIRIAKKMLTNTLLAPIGISLVFTSVSLLKGQSFREARIKVKTDMPQTFLAGTCYWPFISFINFRFIPLDYRPFVGSLAGAIWNIYISSVANKTVESSNDTSRPLTRTTTTVIAEIGGTTVPALREAWDILDHNKKNSNS
ncbi:unnamed protein product [Rotaria sp. Silwood1]|nr:unnamed protein product [Rotaria sp. Silwood1]CAF3802043.1 unnamed protein product [Rotaria sp. Silwood1]CAF4737033.1 unnamed protein product [Rotaria sp. Silwood1]CAF4760140.1 unnamed protein product [Rotaria sp. Silwood1]CAF4832504.1 unnamed protein product [Rotaria sp. Silwood1]